MQNIKGGESSSDISYLIHCLNPVLNTGRSNSMMESLRNYAWIFVLIISLAVIYGTIAKMKGSVWFRTGFGLIRAVIFFVLFYNPLINQPRLSDGVAFPITGIVFFLFGLVLMTAGIKSLTRTDLSGVKGIPDKIIRTGIHGIIRHPVNLGFINVFIGWYTLWGGVYSLCFLPVLVILFIIVSLYEERNLIKSFGNEYIEYKKQVGMFFPRLNKK